YVVFFWLMWNDFGITLIEQIGSLNSFLMRDLGASFMQMTLIGSVGAFVLPWINPIVSTWSDRHRGKYGRRRPFLFFAAPFFAVCLASYPYMPGLYRYLMHHYHWMVTLSAHFPMKGEIIFMGISSLISGVFNGVLLAIFSYLYWDVVPLSVLGRFQSLSKIVAMIAALIWSFFIFGHGQTGQHPRAVYVCTAIFALTIYLISVWQIKEGEYPPPDQHKKGGFIAPVRAYFVECYSQPYYMWIFVASWLYQTGNLAGMYQQFYLKEDLHMNLTMVGAINGWVNLATTGFGMLFGFYIGGITDKLKPVRLVGPSYFILAATVFGAFLFITGEWSAVGWGIARNAVSFGQGIIIGALTAELFPREKLGQFCSAQAVFYQVLNAIANPFIGDLFDHLKNNRLGYLWTAVFYALSGVAYLKVYSNWKKRHGMTPVPHAG
ncbi:MAG: MFS transporter, partial [Chthoniobacteraceae bacterium]